MKNPVHVDKRARLPKKDDIADEEIEDQKEILKETEVKENNTEESTEAEIERDSRTELPTKKQRGRKILNN